MKRFQHIVFAVIILLGMSVETYAAQKEKIKKVIKKEFPVLQDAKLSLNNSFGDISCTIWDKNEISVEVVISVDSKSEEGAQTVFSKVDISFLGSESEVSVKTTLARNLNAKEHFRIDYTVMMPSGVSLDLTNKFGDVMIRELNAKSAIHVEYGKAVLGKLNHGDNLLEVAFGSASVESMKGAVVIIQFSRMRLSYAGSLKISSKYSDIEAGEVVVMDGTFEGGTVELDQASVLTLETRFTGFSIGTVIQKINLKARFGSFALETLSMEFKSLVIDNQHGSVEIGFPEELSYTLAAESRFGSIRFPKENASFSVSNTSSQDEIYKGTVGISPTAVVKIRNEFGSIKL